MIKTVITIIFLGFLLITTIIFGLPINDKKKSKRIIKKIKNIILKNYKQNKLNLIILFIYSLLIVIGIIFTNILRINVNPFNIKNINIIKDAINFYIVSYGAILAIIASLMFFIYSSTQQKYKRYNHIYISVISFKLPYFIVITNMVLGLYYLTGYNTINEKNIKSYYVNLIIFVLTLIYLYYVIKKSVLLVYGKDIYINKIKEITPFDIEYFRINKYVNDKREIELLEKNNIVTTSELLLNYIDNGDNINSRILITEIERKLESIIKNDIGKQGITIREVLNTLSYVYNKASKSSIDNNNNTVLYYIMEMSLLIHEKCAYNKVAWSEYFEYDEYLKSLSKKIFSIDDSDLKNRYIYRLMNLQIKHLKYNCPKKEEIIGYYIKKNLKIPDNDILKTNQWNYVELNQTYLINDIIKEIIEVKDSELFSTYLYASFNHLSKLNQLKNDEYIKDVIINRWIYYIQENIIESLQNKIFTNKTFYFTFSSFMIEEILMKKNQQSINFIIMLLKVNDSSFENDYHDLSIIDALFTEFRVISNKMINDEFYIKTLIFFFDYLLIFIKKIDDLNDNILYISFFELVDSNHKWFSQNNDFSLNQYFEEIKRKLPKYFELKNKIDSEIVNWPESI